MLVTPETGKDAWRKANSAIFAQTAQQFNAANNLEPGDPRYIDPQMMKAWAMVESGGSKAAFLSDPFQVNNRLDWDAKSLIGLTKGQVPTPALSASAAVQWLDMKDHRTFNVTDNSGRHKVKRYLGMREALVNYNGSPHKESYASRILHLAGHR